ncbi:hypothetical protein [Enterococcus sp. AZ109]|uniref:hypothetical protein n=1 Tax=Enterococcus sp. AZ109 TaxID=2774634 RepID=UPI003F23BCAB
MEHGRRGLRSLNPRIVVVSIFLLVFSIFYYFKLADYGGWLWRIMLIFTVDLSVMILLLALNKRQTMNAKNFRDHLWESNEYTKDDGLCIHLKIGKIQLAEKDLSRFLIFKGKKVYVLQIPFFNWAVKVNSEVLPFKLKAKLFKPSSKRNSGLKSSDIFKILTRDEKKKIMIPVLSEIFLVVAYYIVYSLFKENLVGKESLLPSLFNLVFYFTILAYAMVLYTQLTNLTLAFEPGIGLPKVEGEKYIYYTEGMVIELSSKDVKISYDEERSILITEIKSFRYARKLHKSLYLDFQEKIQR